MINKDGEFIWHDARGNEGVMKLNTSDPSSVSVVLREEGLTTVVALHQIRDARTLRALAGAALRFAQLIDPLTGSQCFPVLSPDRLT